jgi:mRNA interferase RelE/StbE
VADYDITFARSARRELEGMERKAAQRILRRIEDLADDPRPHGCRKLQGGAELWRIRMGEYRVVYSVDDDAGMVDIIAVRHRRDVYR